MSLYFFALLTTLSSLIRVSLGSAMATDRGCQKPADRLERSPVWCCQNSHIHMWSHEQSAAQRQELWFVADKDGPRACLLIPVSGLEVFSNFYCFRRHLGNRNTHTHKLNWCKLHFLIVTSIVSLILSFVLSTQRWNEHHQHPHIHLCSLVISRWVQFVSIPNRTVTMAAQLTVAWGQF